MRCKACNTKLTSDELTSLNPYYAIEELCSDCLYIVTEAKDALDDTYEEDCDDRF